MPTVIVDKRGRVTIPIEIRSRLAIKPGSRLEVSVEDGRIVLRPTHRLRARDLLGIAGPDEVDIEEVEKALGESS